MCGGGEVYYSEGETCLFEPVQLMFLQSSTNEFFLTAAANITPLLITISAGLAIFFTTGRKRKLSAIITALCLFWMVSIHVILSCYYRNSIDQVIGSIVLFLPIVIIGLCIASLWQGAPQGRAWIDRIGIAGGIFALFCITATILLEMKTHWVGMGILLALAGLWSWFLPKRRQP